MPSEFIVNAGNNDKAAAVAFHVKFKGTVVGWDNNLPFNIYEHLETQVNLNVIA